MVQFMKSDDRGTNRPRYGFACIVAALVLAGCADTAEMDSRAIQVFDQVCVNTGESIEAKRRVAESLGFVKDEVLSRVSRNEGLFMEEPEGPLAIQVNIASSFPHECAVSAESEHLSRSASGFQEFYGINGNYALKTINGRDYRLSYIIDGGTTLMVLFREN